MTNFITKLQLGGLACLFLLTGHVSANTVSFSGDTAGEPTYNRLIRNCGALSAVATAVAYQTNTFTLNTNANDCSLSITAGGLLDPYLFIYSPTFNPASPASNCIAGNDDGGGGLNPLITNPNLVAGQTYTFVTTGFGNRHVGSYNASISCPTAIVTLNPSTSISTPVPTLSQWALMLLIITLGFFGFRLKGKKSL